MAFRADEAAHLGYEHVQSYLIPKSWDAAQQAASKEALADIVDEFGPAITRYPTWHPLVANHKPREDEFFPSDRCGYKGLDHTRCFVNAFITCPYGDGQDIIDSVRDLPYNSVATVSAERLDVKFYSLNATPILVKCEWTKFLSPIGMIPLSLALPMILEKEVPRWRDSELAETWESMRPYFLGAPHGSRSSLFVDQETGQAIKKVWNLLIYSGMFGNIKV